MQPSTPSPSEGSRPCGCSEKGRNLVVCIDGTRTTYGAKNTNVVELCSHIVKSGPGGTEQLVYYECGIGTLFKSSWTSYFNPYQIIANTLDLAIALNIEHNIMKAYRWLSKHYQPGDKIFLFGFSRGAYQVRALAGMISIVGLINPGHKGLIPLAFKRYSDYALNDDTKMLAEKFMTTFSVHAPKVHFVGVWDTVSSVGIIRSKRLLPRVVHSHNHICIFRHALALDERRVKFAPEYINEGASWTADEVSDINYHSKNDMSHRISVLLNGLACTPQPVMVEHAKSYTSDIQEVWFAGSHSDIGGCNRGNTKLESGDIPLHWMRNQAMLAGLGLAVTDDVRGGLDDLAREPAKSLTAIWWLLECLPLHRLSYRNATDTTRMPNGGRTRKLVQGQKIHVSVICKHKYRPSQTLPEDVFPFKPFGLTPDEPPSWPVQLPDYRAPEFHDRLDELGDIWDKSFFDYSVLREFMKGQAAQVIDRIAFISTFDNGKAAISQIKEALDILNGLLKHDDRGICLNGAITLCELGSLSTEDNTHQIFADDGIATHCLDFIMEELFKSNKMDAAKIQAAYAIPSLIKNEHLRGRLMKERLIERLVLLWRTTWDDESATDIPVAKVRAACVQALSHLLDNEDARSHVHCDEALIMLKKEKNDNALSNDVQIFAARMFTQLAHSDQSRQIILGTTGLPVIKGMVDPKTKPALPVQAAYLKMLFSLTRNYGDARASLESHLIPILISILTRGDPSLIPDAAATLCNLVPDDDVILLSLEVLLNRMESKDRHTWTSCFHGLKSLVYHDSTSHVVHKPTLVNALTKKMEHGKSHSDAARALSELASHPDDNMRKAIIESNFAKQLRHKFINGGADTSQLLHALHSLVDHGDIRDHIITTIVSPLVKEIGKGNFHSIKFAYECVRPSLLKHYDLREAFLKSELVEALQKLVANAHHYQLYCVIYILHSLDAYDDTRDAILQSKPSIISDLVRKSETHHFLRRCFTNTKFSDSTRSVIDEAFRTSVSQDEK